VPAGDWFFFADKKGAITPPVSPEQLSGNKDGVVHEGVVDGQGQQQKPELVEGKGRTRPQVVARALGLEKGGVFRLNNSRFRKMMRQGPFERCWIHVAPTRDGQVGLELAVVERPSFVFEPGVSKSLHLRDWMGDLYFEDKNFLGFNQVSW